MIDKRTTEIAIVEGLSKYCGCEVVRANQTAPIPPYPYGAYTIITPVSAYGGGYSYDPNSGKHFISYKQTWSFTFQSDDEDEALITALRAYDWFKLAGLVYLNDNGIVVLSCSDMNNRDNLISIEYEHRNGFDVVLSLTHTVEMTEAERGGVIETATISNNDMEVNIEHE